MALMEREDSNCCLHSLQEKHDVTSGKLPHAGIEKLTCHCRSSSTRTCQRCSRFHTRSRVYCEGIHGPETRHVT